MKIRKGFVSNSSSSSFIITIAVVTDRAKLAKKMKEFKVDTDDVAIIEGIGDYHENHKGRWSGPFDGGDWAGNYFGLSDVEAAIWRKDPMATVLVSTEYGGEGDYAFCPEDDDDYYEMNYDIVDESWFNDWNQYISEAGDDAGINIIHCFIGAGRDG